VNALDPGHGHEPGDLLWFHRWPRSLISAVNRRAP
jgi:hypothetical protein